MVDRLARLYVAASWCRRNIKRGNAREATLVEANNLFELGGFEVFLLQTKCRMGVHILSMGDPYVYTLIAYSRPLNPVVVAQWGDLVERGILRDPC